MKRWAVHLAHVVLCASLPWMAGCATASRSGSSPGNPSAASSATDFSEALARYSTGLALEWQGEDAASFSNFLRAAELDPDNEELQFRVALNLVHQQRAGEAVALMERLAKRRPKSERAQLWLALIYHATGDFPRALATYDRVRKLNPRAPVAYLQKAELQLRQKQVDEAAETLRAGLDRVEDTLELYRALGPLEHSRARADLAARRKPAHLASAVRLFERGLQEHPGDEGLRELLGRLYILGGQIDQALATYAPLEQAAPGDLRRAQQLALTFLLAPDRTATLEALAARAEQEPPNARALYYLGTVMEHSRLPLEAAEAYRRAITADPAWPAPYLRRVVLQVASDEPEEAILTLEDGLQQQPDEVRFLELLAYLHLGRQDYPAALEAFARAEKALDQQKKQPVSASFFLSYAFAQQAGGQYAAAADRLGQAMDRNPAFLDAYVQFAFRSRDTNHVDGCARVLEELGARTNAAATVLAYQGMLFNYREQYAEAITAFERAEQRAREQENADELLGTTFYFWYASACERHGQFDRAVALFERILADPPPPGPTEDYKAYVDTLNYHAYMHAERGLDLDRALTNINRALEARPDSAAFIDTRGWIYFMQGRYEEARADIVRALELLPDDPTITDHMGDIEAKLGRANEALLWWRKSFLLDPTQEKVAAKLAAQGVDLEALRRDAAELAGKKADAAEPGSSVLPDFGVDDAEPLLPGEAPAELLPVEPEPGPAP